jgi:hypothetical protein
LRAFLLHHLKDAQILVGTKEEVNQNYFRTILMVLNIRDTAVLFSHLDGYS